jgi:hypothetical protein
VTPTAVRTAGEREDARPREQREDDGAEVGGKREAVIHGRSRQDRRQSDDW